MKRILLDVTALVWLGGCVAVPRTSSDLVSTSTVTESFCYSLPRITVSERVEGLLRQCYGPVEAVIPVGGAYVPIRADFQVVNEELPSGNRYSVRNFVGFGYSAEVLSNVTGCETAVRMYAVSAFWKKTFTAVNEAIIGEELKCP